MSVIVKGLDEPERCDLCPFFRTYRYSPNVWCNGCNRVLIRLNDPMEVVDLEVDVPDWCPIRPMPESRTGQWIPVTKIYKTTDEEYPEMHIKWVDAIEPDEEDAVRCSECKTVFDFESARNWCSECGARMEEGGKKNDNA